MQLLADAAGEVMYLFERDQPGAAPPEGRRDRPAPNLDPLRDRLCADAVRFGVAVGYRNAGTVEFLVGADGSHVFIEMNLRIQVEHTVTEETTDVDLVSAQLRIAGGATSTIWGCVRRRSRSGVSPSRPRHHGEPRQRLRPDTGRISAYFAWPAARASVWTAGRTTSAPRSAPTSTLLVKLTARGPDLHRGGPRAARRRVPRPRVGTNLAFLRALLATPTFWPVTSRRRSSTTVPSLTAVEPGLDRASRLLALLADRTVNRPHGLAAVVADLLSKAGAGRDVPLPGSRQRLA